MSVQEVRFDDAVHHGYYVYDVMIVDPPYSEHVHKNATSQQQAREKNGRVMGTRKNDLGFDHLSPELRAYIAGCVARVRRWSIIYSDIEGLADWRRDIATAGGKYIRAMPWVRWSMPQLSGDRPPQGFELVTAYWGSATGRKSWNGPGSLTHLAHKCLRGEGKHKTEKPLDQALDLVDWFSEPGETVFDPCAGSGVVGLACKILGRNYVGFEIDYKWAVKAQNRIDRTDMTFPDRPRDLNPRDTERYIRWRDARAVEVKAQEKRDANTAKVRARLEVRTRQREGVTLL